MNYRNSFAVLKHKIYGNNYFAGSRLRWGPSWGMRSPAPSSSASPPGGWWPSSGNIKFTDYLEDFLNLLYQSFFL